MTTKLVDSLSRWKKKSWKPGLGEQGWEQGHCKVTLQYASPNPTIENRLNQASTKLRPKNKGRGKFFNDPDWFFAEPDRVANDSDRKKTSWAINSNPQMEVLESSVAFQHTRAEVFLWEEKKDSLTAWTSWCAGLSIFTGVLRSRCGCPATSNGHQLSSGLLDAHEARRLVHLTAPGAEREEWK